MIISDQEMEEAHLSQLAHLRDQHEERVRELTSRQRAERANELELIKEAAERQGPPASGENVEEDLFAHMMQENVLGDADAREIALVRQLDKRQAAERKELRKLVQCEGGEREESTGRVRRKREESGKR
jgi:hypothetical protein